MECRLSAITFVYKCNECGKYSCWYLDELPLAPEPGPYCKDCAGLDVTHLSTVNPAAMLERYLNKDRTVRKTLQGEKT